MADAARAAQLRERLAAVDAQIANAAASVGRVRDDVTLVVVTKTWPASDIRALHDLGVRDIGENRHPEAETKAEELAALRPHLAFHRPDPVEQGAADRRVRRRRPLRRLRAAGAAAQCRGPQPRARRRVLRPGQPRSRSTRAHVVAAASWPASSTRSPTPSAAAEALKLRGVMGVAPLGGDAAEAYERLAVLSQRLRAGHPQATAISAGMTGDYLEAISAGATHVRVGSAILGERPPLR